VNGEYYVSLAYKPLLANGQPVVVYPLQHFMQWGTPGDVAEYNIWSKAFRLLVAPVIEDSKAHGSLIVTMAGLGQRFANEGYELIKPLIPVSGMPMVAEFGEIDSTLFQFSLDGNSWTDGGFMKDDGIFPDALANDGIYSSSLPEFPSADLVYCRAAMIDSAVFSPCDGRALFLTESNSQIFINEVMTDNATVIADENGQYDDWIELWNAGGSPISLNGKFLSDDADEPYKFALPNVALTPGQHLIFWADNDEMFNRYHTNFSLSAGGETLKLYTKELNSPRLVDVVEIPEISEDFSYGRLTDGSAVWFTFENGKLIKKGENEFELQGEMTIRDVTKTIALKAELGGIEKDPWGNEKAGFSIDGKINRKDFGLVWNTVTESGGLLVSEDVRILAEVQLVKA
jgi:hypothetical protein